MPESISFEAIGSWWQVTLELPASPRESKESTQNLIEIKRKMLDRIDEYDRAFSRFRPDSLVSMQAGNQSLDTSSFPAYAQDLFDFYEKMESLTDGLFTAKIGTSLAAAGYDAQYSLGRKNIQITEQTKKIGAALDYGAAGKGHLVALIGDILQEIGCTTYVINGSGDILHRGSKHIRVGLEHPLDNTKIIGVSTIKNTSLCGSASNRRRWASYHHIMNPQTKQSPEHIMASWVQAKSTMLADGLATALFVCTPEHIKKLKSAFDFEHLILYTNGDIEKTAKFQAELFIE